MILDSGIATVFKRTNVAGFGEKPRFSDTPFFRSWYKELSFSTSPAFPTDRRQETLADARVRLLQNRQISMHDQIILSPACGETRAFEITRAFHGRDDESGELISDLTLRLITP